MTRAAVVTAGLLLMLHACGGEPAPSGYDQPLRVPGAFFKEGDLEHFASGVDDDGPRVTAITTTSNVLRPRQAGITVSGRTSGSAYSVALRLRDLGTGYWVLPVGAEDLAAPGELGWQTTFELGEELAPGEHRLEAVALDEHGVSGPSSATRLCVTNGVDTTRNACDRTVQPPAAAISLAWDGDADVDLVLVTPAGRTVDASHVATLLPEDDEAHFDATAPGVGVLQADSNPGCAIDSIRRETVTWLTSAEPGEYLVYANVYEACGQQAVHFTLEAYARTEGDEPGTYGFEALQDPIYGVLLGGSANGGKARGLYLTAIEFP
jgi:hypothetical protein